MLTVNHNIFAKKVASEKIRMTIVQTDEQSEICKGEILEHMTAQGEIREHKFAESVCTGVKNISIIKTEGGNFDIYIGDTELPEDQYLNLSKACGFISKEDFFDFVTPGEKIYSTYIGKAISWKNARTCPLAWKIDWCPSEHRIKRLILRIWARYRIYWKGWDQLQIKINADPRIYYKEGIILFDGVPRPRNKKHAKIFSELQYLLYIKDYNDHQVEHLRYYMKVFFDRKKDQENESIKRS